MRTDAVLSRMRTGNQLPVSSLAFATNLDEIVPKQGLEGKQADQTFDEVTLQFWLVINLRNLPQQGLGRSLT
jgi:hypothetical protein